MKQNYQNLPNFQVIQVMPLFDFSDDGKVEWHSKKYLKNSFLKSIVHVMKHANFCTFSDRII